jgi:hypothetical protein
MGRFMRGETITDAGAGPQGGTGSEGGGGGSISDLAHEHSNLPVLEELSEDTEKDPTYDGKSIMVSEPTDFEW